MNSDVIVNSKPKVASSNLNRPSTPPCKSLRSEFLSASKPSDTKASKSVSKSSVERTPVKPRHRKTKSQSIDADPQFSSPCKSRLDFDAIPMPLVDVKSCQADIARYAAQQRKDLLAEKKIMTEEWVKAKQTFRNQKDQELMKHEEQMTAEKLEFTRLMLENEKNKKLMDREERIKDFYAVKEAKKTLLQAEKKRELEYINIEREKSIKKQREIEEKRERERNEREEKRKCFLESIAVAKKLQEEESLRIKKEMEFDYAQEIIGQRELLYQQSVFQKSSLDKAGSIILN